MPEQLSGKEQLILQYLQYRQEAGLPPTIKEIARMTGQPTSSVLYTLGKLEGKECIERFPRARGIRVL